MPPPVQHGHAFAGRQTPTYQCWSHMIQRCTNPKSRDYPRYGGRGITVCERWLTFANFLADMGPVPFPGAQIERGENSLGYFKDNCRWATAKEQARNRRSSRVLTHAGRSQTAAAWAEETGIPQTTISMRIDHYGWEVSRALTTPVDPAKRKKSARPASTGG